MAAQSAGVLFLPSIISTHREKSRTTIDHRLTLDELKEVLANDRGRDDLAHDLGDDLGDSIGPFEEGTGRTVSTMIDEYRMLDDEDRLAFLNVEQMRFTYKRLQVTLKDGEFIGPAASFKNCDIHGYGHLAIQSNGSIIIRGN